jgi:hypothetical protein
MNTLRVLSVAGIAALCLSVIASGGVDQTWVAFDYAVSGADCPQTGDLTGTLLIHTVSRTTTDGKGVTHVGLTFTAKGTATNSAGDKWIVSDADSSSSFTGVVGDEFTFTENFRLIGQGKNANVTIRDVGHARIMPDGNVMVSFEKPFGFDAGGCGGNLLQ